jgi:hypothetical protein
MPGGDLGEDFVVLVHGWAPLIVCSYECFNRRGYPVEYRSFRAD